MLRHADKPPKNQSPRLKTTHQKPRLWAWAEGQLHRFALSCYDLAMEEKNRVPRTERIGGYLHRVVPITNNALKPLMVEFRPRDLIQVTVGAAILTVPAVFTKETWGLGTGQLCGNSPLQERNPRKKSGICRVSHRTTLANKMCIG